MIRMIIKIIIYILLCQFCIENTMAGIITGVVLNKETGKPIPLVSVRAKGVGESTLTNDIGQYRLILNSGNYNLKYSHIAYTSKLREVHVSDSETIINIEMQETMIQLPGITVYDKLYDPAQEIILKAIAHKQEILQQLQNYSFDAYVKETAHNIINKDTSKIEGIIETQLECFWKHPDKYKEKIVARHQTSNIKADLNLMSIESIPNFNMNRIKFGQYLIVSPTATDALKYYNYYLMDTTFIDNHMVYRLEVEPKNQTDPLVTGTIYIADSTFSIVGVEGGLNNGVYIPFLHNFHYSQRFDEFKNKYWMPTEISINYTINLNFPIEKTLNINFVAALYNYNFNNPQPKGTFNYALEVAEDADDIDSITWNSRQIISLTPKEKESYMRIDSIVNAPKPLYKKVLSGLQFLLISSFNNDLFRFNRTEGAYLGASHYRFNPKSRIELDMKIGYAFSRKYWQQSFGVSYRLRNNQRLYTGIYYHNEIKHRPVIIASSSFNPATWNLFGKTDPYDYYLEKGFSLFISSNLKNKMNLFISYQDYNQYSEFINTDYSLFSKDKQYRTNLVIKDGKLHSFYARLKYDSRPLLRIKGRDAVLLSQLFTLYELGVEVASPKMIKNDFDFIRYYTRLKRTGNFILPGINTIEIYLGASSGSLPPQNYFTIDFAYKIFDNEMFFRTLDGNNFTGNTVVAMYIHQNFGNWCFKKSGIPLIKKIPLSLSLYGGAFLTKFKNHAIQLHDLSLRTTDTWYKEIGFSLGRISQLNYRLGFTWQLSNYDTNRFSVNIGFGL